MDSFYTIEELQSMGFRYVGKDVKLSRKTSVYGAANISIGDYSRIDDFVILSGNISIGHNVHIAAYCALFGGRAGIEIEDFSGLSSRCVIYAESDDYSGNALTNPTVSEKYRKVYGGKVQIKKHAILGTGVSVLPAVVVGEGSSIGSMSLVNKSVDEWGIYVGIPCRRIRERKKNLLDLEKQFLTDEVSLHEVNPDS